MEAISLDYKKQTSSALHQLVSLVFRKVSKGCYYSYDDIPLRTYLQILQTNDLKLLLKKGKLDDSAAIAWEMITKENELLQGGNSYSIMFDHFSALTELVAEYNEVRITLWTLLYKFDMDKVLRMKELGFKIDCTNNQTYRDTLFNCIRQSKNYATKIKMKRNEIDAELPKEREQQQATFHTLMAQLTKQLKFNIPDDITLARFNAYLKELKDGGTGRTDKEE